MREIKFRAWDRKAKAMFPIHDMKFGKIDNKLNHIGGVDIHHKDSDHEGDVWYGGHPDKKTGSPGSPQVRRFEIMQYTGLIDRNGVEIYEGDVVQYRGTFNDLVGVVSFGPYGQDGSGGEYGTRPCLGFYVERQAIVPNEWDDGDVYPRDYEEQMSIVETAYDVIGNIYEHPHLLESQSK